MITEKIGVQYARMYQNGWKPVEIARHFQVSRAYVSRVLRSQGINSDHLRGFASMNPERHREIARLGGIKSHQTGRGHEFTSEEGRLAGKKGGRAYRPSARKEDQ